MRKLILTVSALALVVPAAMPISTADAQTRYHAKTRHHYVRCRYSKGTTGLVAGGVGGALVGRSILGHGLLGTVAGGVGGAFAGRAIDRSITARKRGCR